MKVSIADLRKIPTLQDLKDEALQWLIDRSECRILQEDEYMFKKGDPINYMHILLKGRLRIKLQQGKQLREISAMETGTITGTLPYSRMQEATGFGIATEETHVLSLHKKHFIEMEQVSRDMVQALVGVMTTRARDFTRIQQQNEKMMALGKLSAGLAHELNNPAAAIVRSSDILRQHMHQTPDNFKKVILIRLEPEQVDAVNDILFSKISTPPPTLSMMERNNQEDEIAEWLEDQGWDEGYEAAENFVEFGITLDDLEEMDEIIEGKHTKPVFNWLNNVLITERLVKEIEEASQRISTLIQSVKTYTHMDRSTEKSEADIHQGLNSTLTMLNHKLKQKNIQINKEYADDVPEIPVYVSEINQVWTNLIDNAVDAMDDKGTLTVRTQANNQDIRVDIIDTGSGIPPDIQGSIFDPFFTTKAVGQGSGLGLDIVQKIIEQHQGTIKVKSEPGETQFTICFPIHSP
ncbi:MAG: ATP-binding protein [Tunicatimonas sp.]|uniref:sensor histidine kinase n=1 Tax=Tunicatimonas sp. TaxID=1940096 RepID=UPI003C719792